MRAALVSEYRKVVSTRTWWILAVCMAAYVAFITAALGLAFSSDSDTRGLASARQVYALANGYGYPFALVVGALLFTTEFRHHTIGPTLLAVPRRGVVLSAKLAVSGALGLVLGVIASAASAGAGGLVLRLAGDGSWLGSGSVWEVLAGNVVAIALWTMLGTVFGGVVVNQVAAIVIVIVFAQFVEPIVRIALSAWSVSVSRLLPGSAADAISGSSFYSQVLGSGSLLAPWQGALVMAGYVVLFALAARYVTLRRDVS